MPLARKLREKNIGVCYFALFSLIIMITSFKRIWHLPACFYKGKISSKSSSLLSVICSSLRFLDAHESVQKKKMKLHETAANKKNQTGIVRTSFLVHWHPHSREWNSTLVPIFPGDLIALDHSVRIFFFFLPLQRYKVKLFYYLHYNARNLRVFSVSHIFTNWVIPCGLIG